MKSIVNLKKRQGGAVAIVVGVGLAMIIGFLALVVDLGHLYVARTGQQNAADAAALSGAKELDGTAAGITRAVAWAKKMMSGCTVDCAPQRNKFLGTLGWEAVSLPDSHIHFSDAPYSSNWRTVTEAGNNPAGLYFIKVDTETGAMGTWFAGIWNILNISTYGSAVAGRFINQIAPIGLCAISTREQKAVTYNAAGDQYTAEYGFVRGVSYDFQQVNQELGGLAPGTELYLHPTATSPETCAPNEGSASFAAPFLCTGVSNISGDKGSQVFTNVGLAAGMSNAALNTRFNQYGPPLSGSINSAACPPDSNIREFTPSFAQSNWMSPLPTQMSAFQLDQWLEGPDGSSVTRDPLAVPASSVVAAHVNDGGCGGDCRDKYGVLWSYNKPAISGAPPATVSELWSQLYGASSVGPTYNNATTSLGDWQSPYSQYITPVAGVQGRRVLNVVLVDCTTTPPSGGNCQPLTVLGVARFFMQRTVAPSAWIAGEYAGLIPEGELQQTIRLYR